MKKIIITSAVILIVIIVFVAVRYSKRKENAKLLPPLKDAPKTVSDKQLFEEGVNWSKKIIKDGKVLEYYDASNAKQAGKFSADFLATMTTELLKIIEQFQKDPSDRDAIIAYAKKSGTQIGIAILKEAIKKYSDKQQTKTETKSEEAPK